MAQWQTKACIITTNLNVKINFTLPELRATKTMMWNFHVDDSAKGIYNMILCRDLLTSLGLNLKLSDHFIEADNETLKGSTAPIVDMVTY